MKKVLNFIKNLTWVDALLGFSAVFVFGLIIAFILNHRKHRKIMIAEGNTPSGGGRPTYETLWNTTEVKASSLVQMAANKIAANKSRYLKVVEGTKIPWYFVGLVHFMESGCKFNTHLHNGDPLSARTVNVPAGRPLGGNAPFTWEYSAKDALQYTKVTQVVDWSIGNTLKTLEGYNGFGYKSKKINSPYLWSFTNHYVKGKYVADNVYDANAVSKQVGAAAILKVLIQDGHA